jgi:hypothetical protein
MSQDLELRIAALEARKPEVGPRGPAGNIDQAVRQASAAANQAVSDAELRVQEYAKASLGQFREELAKLQARFEDLKKNLSATIKDTVDVNVVNTLHEYHLLEDAAPSSKYFVHEIRAIVTEELAKDR